MKNILIPTDFSENAMNAVRYALEFFKYDTCEFYFLHTYEEEVYSNSELSDDDAFNKVMASVSERSKLKLESLISEVKTIAPHDRYKFHMISAYNSLLDEVDKLVIGKDIDIIVMGTKGESKGKSYVFGSNTLQVLKYVSCPVLVIPEFYGYKQPKHIMFPTNYLIPYKRRELKLLHTIFWPFRSVIDMIYISKSSKLSKRQRENKSFIIEELGALKLNFETIYSKNISKVISDYVKSQKIELLVMVNTRHSFLEDMLFRSKVDDICLHTNIPFLVLQNMRRTI